MILRVFEASVHPLKVSQSSDKGREPDKMLPLNITKPAHARSAEKVPHITVARIYNSGASGVLHVLKAHEMVSETMCTAGLSSIPASSGL